MPKLSVIIPVHNGAKKLPRTVKQILNQSFQDFELILVENGSKDNSWQVCEDLSNIDTRVRIAHSDAATTFARKKGIELAEGEYICFSDQDDRYIDNESIAAIISAAEKSKSDIIQFGHYVDRLGRLSQILPEDNRTVTREEFLKKDIAGIMMGYQCGIDLAVWTKVYRTNCLKEICEKITEPLFRGEDMYLNILTFFSESVKSVSYSKVCKYVFVTALGTSGSMDSGTALFKEYQILKPLALRLAKENAVGEFPIVKCHRETLNFMHALIVDSIIRGDKKQTTVDLIKQYSDWDFVHAASAFFLHDNQQWDDHILRLSQIADAEAYYNMCLNDIGNLRRRRIQYKVKNAVKNTLRWIDRL